MGSWCQRREKEGERAVVWAMCWDGERAAGEKGKGAGRLDYRLGRCDPGSAQEGEERLADVTGVSPGWGGEGSLSPGCFSIFFNSLAFPFFQFLFFFPKI